jgi:GNS1/SUR4 family
MDLLTERLAAVRDVVYSSSSGPAAATIPELFTGVAPRSNLLMHPAAPYLAIVLYLLSKPTLVAAVARLGVTGTSAGFKALVLAHNVALAAYSMWTAVNVVPLTVAHFREYGALDAYCGTRLWEDTAGGVKGLGFWAFWFYVSKMYVSSS